MQPTMTPILFSQKRKVTIFITVISFLILGGTLYGFTLSTKAANSSNQMTQPLRQSSTKQISTVRQPFTANTSFDCEISERMPSSECAVLVSLYRDTDGVNWQTNTNWLNTPNPCKWHGIMCNQEGFVLSIDLSDNALTGPLPAELGSLEKLRMLGLWKNNITGSIPQTIGNLSELTILDLSRNNLIGSIPEEIGNLSKLNLLWLSGNRLSGNVPSSLTSLASLTSLHIERNALSGPIPSAIFDLPKNEEFDFSYNAFKTETVDIRSSEKNYSIHTQTLPPTELSVSLVTEDSVMLNWTPIDYQNENGFYEISYRKDDESTYRMYSKTETAVNAAKIDGLLPKTTYHFVVRTYTPPHLLQANALWSTYSNPVSQTTAAPSTITAEQTLQPAPDLVITAVEITQGLQNLANDMPLIADRKTWVRVYAISNLYNVDGVSAQLRAFQDGSELVGSPLAMKYAPITVRADGGSRLNMDDSFHFELPPSWLTGSVTFLAELNPESSVPESAQTNNSWEESVTFHASDPLSLVMVPIKLYKDGDSSQPEHTYKTDQRIFDKIIANSYRYMPVSTIEWREHSEILEPDCQGTCNIEAYTDPTPVLEQLELMRAKEEEVNRFYETSTNEHWVGMVDPVFIFGGLSIRPQKSHWQNYSAWSSISSVYSDTHTAPYEVGGSLTMMHEIGHNLGMMHIDCRAGEPNISTHYPFSATDNTECSLDEINESGFYGFDVYYQAAGLEKPVIISNDPAVGNDHRAYPMMSYKFPSWPSPYKYCQLLIKFNVACTLYNYENTAVTGLSEEPTSVIDLGDVQLFSEMRQNERGSSRSVANLERLAASYENYILQRDELDQSSVEPKNTVTKRIIEVEPLTGESSLEVVDIQDAEYGYATTNGQILYYISQEDYLLPETIIYTVRDQKDEIIEKAIKIGTPSSFTPQSIMLPLVMNK